MKHVLIVDDDAAAAASVRKTIDDIYEVSVLNMENTVNKNLNEIHPDLILLGLPNQKTDVSATLQRIKNNLNPKEIPVIIINNQSDTELERKALKSGAVDVITVPFSPEILRKRISTQLELFDYRNDAALNDQYQDAISVSLAELVECRDVTTGGHLKHTTAYFKLLLNEVISRKEYKDAIPEEDVRDLIRSAPLHDIGKIGINDDILRKDSALDDSEFEFMKTHTTLGKVTFDKIMKETGETRLLKLARDLAFCHHEKWDGTGYPSGLKGEEIPIYARILTIADVYDALTSKRTYKEAFSHEKAVKIILDGRGSYFDPSLVDIFYDINDKFKEVLKLKNEAES